MSRKHLLRFQAEAEANAAQASKRDPVPEPVNPDPDGLIARGRKLAARREAAFSQKKEGEKP